MPYLSNISHPNANIREKVEFFIDYYNFVNQSMGKLNDIQFENHFSLIEKCIYQIEKNPKNSTPYIDNYLSNPILDVNGFLGRNEEFKRFKKQVKRFQANSSFENKRGWLKNNDIFLAILKELKIFLEKEYFDLSLKELISFLKCKHKLRTHKGLIMFYTQIIVSEFKYNNFSEKGVSEAVTKIMSDNIYVFPFPDTITDNADKEEFIRNRDFNSQFLGLKNIYGKKIIKSYYIFRVLYLSADDSQFKIDYDDVTFISPDHPDFVSMKDKVKKSAKVFLENFFSQYDSFILVYTQVSFKNNDEGAKKAIDRISAKLKDINFRLKCSGIIDRESYLMTSDFKNVGVRSGYNPKIKNKSLKERHVDKIDDNIYHILRDTALPIKNPLIFFEDEFLEGFRDENVSKLWEYLEHLIPIREDGEKQVKEVVSNILSLDYRYQAKTSIKVSFTDSVSGMSISSSEIGIPAEVQNYIRKNFLSIDPIPYMKQIKRPFVKQLYRAYLKHRSKKNLSNVKKYYISILTESYELRNMKIHSGRYNRKVEIKLVHIFPRIVNMFRNILIHECPNYEGNSFEGMISKLNNDAKKLLIK